MLYVLDDAHGGDWERLFGLRFLKEFRPSMLACAAFRLRGRISSGPCRRECDVDDCRLYALSGEEVHRYASGVKYRARNPWAADLRRMCHHGKRVSTE